MGEQLANGKCERGIRLKLRSGEQLVGHNSPAIACSALGAHCLCFIASESMYRQRQAWRDRKFSTHCSAVNGARAPKVMLLKVAGGRCRHVSAASER